MPSHSYLRDIKASGFKLMSKEEIGWLAAAHLRAQAMKHLSDPEHPGQIKDAWLQFTIQQMDKGSCCSSRLALVRP